MYELRNVGVRYFLAHFENIPLYLKNSDTNIINYCVIISYKVTSKRYDKKKDNEE